MRHARRLAGTEGRLRHARVTRGLVSESRDSRSPGGTRVGRAGRQEGEIVTRARACGTREYQREGES